MIATTAVDGPDAIPRDAGLTAVWSSRRPPLRVALFNVTTTTRLGGVESFVWDLARALAAAGLRVDVIGGIGPIERAAPGVRIIRAPFLSRETLRRNPLLRRQYGATKLLERLSFGLSSAVTLARGQYDILHLQKPFDLPVAALIRRLSAGRTRVVLGCHGRDFFAGDRRFIGSIDAAVACSATNADEVAARYGLRPEVIYNGIDLDRFRPRPPEPAVRASLGLGADAPVLLAAGRLVQWKGIGYAIEALPLVNAVPAPTLVIAGDGPYRDTLEALTARLRVRDRVLFLGQQDYHRMPGLYGVADIVLGTSFLNETFGITLCEALASERAVIATDFGGFREVIRHGKTGLLVPPRSPRALARAIDELLANPAKRVELGQAGRRDVAARFSWSAVVQRVLAAYEVALR